MATNFRELSSPLTAAKLAPLGEQVERIQVAKPFVAADVSKAADFIARNPNTILRLYNSGSTPMGLGWLRDVPGLRRLWLDFEDDTFLDVDALSVVTPKLVELWLPKTNKAKKNLHALERLEDLEILGLAGKLPVVGLEIVGQLPKLQVLDLNRIPLPDLTALAPCTFLKRLKLSKAKVESLAGIEKLRRLESLELSDVTGLQGIAPAEALPNLRSIDIRVSTFTQPLESLAAFAALEQLTALHVKPDLRPALAWTAPSLQTVELHSERDYSEKELRALPAHPRLRAVCLGHLEEDEARDASAWARVKVVESPGQLKRP